jgi:hypothetical protein
MPCRLWPRLYNTYMNSYPILWNKTWFFWSVLGALCRALWEGPQKGPQKGLLEGLLAYSVGAPKIREGLAHAKKFPGPFFNSSPFFKKIFPGNFQFLSHFTLITPESRLIESQLTLIFANKQSCANRQLHAARTSFKNQKSF